MPEHRPGKGAAAHVGQSQFLDVVTRDEATTRFREHLRLAPLGRERASLRDALHRVLADDIVAEVDVPGFDRSYVDGFAVQAKDTFGAMEESPRRVATNNEVLAPGIVPVFTVATGVATPIATGGVGLGVIAWMVVTRPARAAATARTKARSPPLAM